jgi:lipooligosaccharide transport system ATP-binding protein
VNIDSNSTYPIHVENLRKKFGEFEALKGISFDVKQGEIFGFLGPNGAGKTTAMRIITCFMRAASGKCTILGMDADKNPSEIKARLGVAAQENNLDPDITVFDNLIVYAGYFGIPKRIAMEKARDILSSVELYEKLHSPIQALSGGMLRRLMIARALINTPDILIMDEPTTGLDPRSRRLLWDTLAQLKAKTGFTMLLSTHYMEEAAALCSRTAIMNRGEIVTLDAPQNLMNMHGGTLEDVYLKLTGLSLAEDEL